MPPKKQSRVDAKSEALLRASETPEKQERRLTRQQLKEANVKAAETPEQITERLQFEPLVIESKNAATAILMLQSPEEEVLVEALEAIYRFAEKGPENKSSLMALGAVEPLTCLIKHDDKTICSNALMALGAMVTDSDVKRLIKKHNIIPSLITKLAPEEDIGVHEFATLLLAHLSVDMSCKVEIFQHDGLEHFLHLLSSPDADVKKYSLECIYNLVQEVSCREAVHKLNGIPPILELLNSEYPIIQQFALHALEGISPDRRTRTAFREQQGFTRLLEFLTNNEFGDLHMEALKVLSNFIEDAESMKLIQENGGLEMLLQFSVTGTTHDTQANAVKAISKAAQSSKNRKILHEEHFEKVLIELLAVENDSIHIAVCQAVSAMSTDPCSRDTFRQFDGITQIVQLLSSERNEVKEVAVEALSSLTHENKLNAYAVYEMEGDKLLVQLLQNGSRAAAVYTTAVLTNMASHEYKLRCSILSHGAMQALLKLLQSSDKPTVISATQAVTKLACESEGRAELRKLGGVTHLVNLLTTKDTEIRENASLAVMVCAKDDTTASELFRLGALEILQEINCSVNRKNKISELALKKLLDRNLSVKYSLTGHLSCNDNIADGFYDPGQTKEGHRVPDLADIAKQAINQHRAIIAVNGTPPANESKGSGGQENEKQRHEDESKPHQEIVIEEAWTLPYDAQLNDLIKETFNVVVPLNEVEEMYTTLAKLVCDAMGGPVDINKPHEFLWELHLSELKVEMQSNIIPIGKIKKGTYYHRALLFKVLADRIGLVCSLVRGQYGRAWNEVLLDSSTKATGNFPKFQHYIIDLMHKPGTFIKCGTPVAAQYQTI